MFRVVKSGKTKRKAWKRMITKATFVGEGFTRKPPKYERFIRPRASATSVLTSLIQNYKSHSNSTSSQSRRTHSRHSTLSWAS